MNPTFKAAGAKRLKLSYDEPLSNYGFSINLRRYSWVPPPFVPPPPLPEEDQAPVFAPPPLNPVGPDGTCFDCLPKFPMLNSPNSAYYARIIAYYAKSNAGIFRMALESGAAQARPPHARAACPPPGPAPAASPPPPARGRARDAAPPQVRGPPAAAPHPAAVAGAAGGPQVGRCRLTVLEPVLKAPMVSALEPTI